MFDKTYVTLRKNNNTPIVTLHIKRSSLASPIFTHMHYHDDFEILYFVKGTANMTVGGKTFTVSENSLILINPFEMHFGETNEEIEYYCINFDLKYLGIKTESELLSQRIKYNNHITDSTGCAEYILNIHSSFTSANNDWDLYAKANLLMLLYNLRNELTESYDTHTSSFEKQIIDYIDINYMNNITSADISNALGYNHNYFCRAFKKSFSCRFCDYLNNYRIRMAQELLPLHKVADVAEMVGYTNVNYFYMVFKKTAGISPSEYKKKLSR